MCSIVSLCVVRFIPVYHSPERLHTVKRQYCSMRNVEVLVPVLESKKSQTFASIYTQHGSSIQSIQNEKKLCNSSIVSQNFADSMPDSNLLYRRLGRPTHDECQHPRHKADYNCCKWCMAVVCSANGILDDLERASARKEKQGPTRNRGPSFSNCDQLLPIGGLFCKRLT